jgi:transposase
MNYIAFDSHKHYTQACVQDLSGNILQECRIEHERGALARFLRRWNPGSPVALETLGNWYWIVDEIESAGMKPRLVHARKAKLMMGMINKTDKLDARGLNLLQRNNTLPTVWIPPSGLRDLRDLPRTRMVATRERARLKNRIHATLSKYAVKIDEVRDMFGVRGRKILELKLSLLPPHTEYATRALLAQLDASTQMIKTLEARMHKTFDTSPELDLVRSLPGIGFILGTVIMLETGDIKRFPSAEKYASYSGTAPRVSSSGGHTHIGRLRADVNRYLKWAYIEAANVVCVNHKKYPERHISKLYARIARKRGHGKAIGAVARHLSEASFWMQTKGESYREPALRVPVLSTGG